MPVIYEKSKNLVIKPPDDIIDVEKNKLLKLINSYSQFSSDQYSTWNYDLEDEAEMLFDEIRSLYNIEYKDYWISFGDGYYDYRLPLSLRYEILNKLACAGANNLQPHELLLFKKFLETPEGKELEAWAWWEEYWKNRVKPEE